jgi:hypothetical protein
LRGSAGNVAIRLPTEDAVAVADERAPRVIAVELEAADARLAQAFFDRDWFGVKARRSKPVADQNRNFRWIIALPVA